MSLALEIEWLAGVCRASRDPADPEADWPVQPDRVFSALVASWGLTGANDEGRRALEWLETQPPPRLFAVEGRARTAVTGFVPPNDPSAGDIRILPERRRRQPRRHPARVLGPAAVDAPFHMQLVWATAPDPGVAATLERLARDTSFVGHSASLVRCRFTPATSAPDDLGAKATRGAPYRGRLRELEAQFERFGRGAEKARPSPAMLTPPVGPAAEAEPPESVFGRRWTVLVPEGRTPELIDAASIAGTLRDRLMKTFPDPLPEWLSGHAADGAPSRAPHLAIAPLAHVGSEHGDGAVKGFALILPREVEAAMTGDTPAGFALRAAFADGAAKVDGWSVHAGDGLTSLKPERYLGPARRWATVTPIALDLHPKDEAWIDAAPEQIRKACTRIGLPEPATVRAAKHSAARGAPSAWPVRGAPSWTGWARPKSLGARPLVHAVIDFAEVVCGPVLLGAGRFRGLGLCLPID